MLSQSKIRAIFFFSVIAVVSVFGFVEALSQWQFNQDFKVSDNYVGLEKGRGPRVAMSNSGNSVIVWIEANNELYYQLMDQNNCHIGISVPIATSVFPSDFSINVGMNATGDFSVVWVNDPALDIYLKRFDSNGTALGAEIKVNENIIINHYGFCWGYAMNDNGNSVLVWENNKEGYKNIFGQYYNSNGTPKGSNFEITENPSSAENHPDVAIDGHGNFVAIWIDSTSCNAKLYGKRYDSSCNSLGPKFLIDAWDEFSYSYDFPSVAMNDQGYFLVCWQKWDQQGQRNFCGLLFDPQGNPTGIEYQVNSVIDAVLFDDNSSILMGADTKFQRFASDGSPVGGIAKANIETSSLSSCIAGNNFKDFIIAWHGKPYVGAALFHIYSQRYFNDGQRNGPNVLVCRKLESNIRQDQPSIACNGSGRFVITWDDNRNHDLVELDSYVQFLSSEGDFVRNNFYIKTGLWDQINSSSAMKEDGSFLVIWIEDTNCAGLTYEYNLFAKWYDADGIPSPQFIVNDSYCTVWRYAPKIKIAKTGDFIIVWSDSRQYAYRGKIYCQMFDANSNPIGANFEVNDPIDRQVNCNRVSLGIDNNRNFVVVWETDLNGNWDIYGKIYNSEGIPYQANFMINDDGGSSTQAYPAVSMHSDGTFVVTWTDTREGNNDIFAQRYDSNWNPIGNNFIVNDGGLTSSQSNPSIAFTPDGKFVIAWQDGRNGNNDIYAQKFNADGSKLGGNYRVNDDDGAAIQSYPQVDCNSENIYFTWQDNRIPNEDYDIFARVELFSGEQHLIVIQQPDAGDKWIIGTTNRITWNSSDLGGTLLIELSTDNGFSWKTISSNTPFDAPYVEYTPAAEISDHCFIKIISNDFPTVSDLSDRFNIFKPIKRYTAKQFSINSDPITLDGMLTEGVWNDAETDSLLFGGNPEEWTSNWTNFSDHLVSWKALWSPENNRVYLALEILDDIRGTLDNNDPNEIPFYPFNDESIELYVDGDHSGGIYEGQYQSAQQWLITPENLHLLSNYPAANSIGVYAGSAVQSAVALGANGNWTVEIEMAIYNSFETEARTLAAGDTIGWDIWYNDSDDETQENNKYVRDHQTGWYYTGPAYKNSDCFGELILSQMVVPVELYAFHAEAVEKSVRLTWQTASEINNYGFDVQRGSDGIHFEKIGFVPGNGTTNSSRSYTFHDKNVSQSMNYYRLKILDYDGNYSFSSMAQVSINQPTTFHLYANYPNPFNPETTIKYDLADAKLVVIKIYNLSGKEVATLVDEHQKPGSYSIMWRTQNVPSGIYLCRMEASSYRESFKLTILK